MDHFCPDCAHLSYAFSFRLQKSERMKKNQVCCNLRVSYQQVLIRLVIQRSTVIRLEQVEAVDAAVTLFSLIQ